MTGMNGINYPQRMPRAMQVNKTSKADSSAAAAQANAQGSTVSTVGGGKLDSVSFSAGADLAAQPADISDVRMAKVEKLRKSIASGNYNVPASAVADKMVESMLRSGRRKT
jgi:flagellar biosynthesis anti-sigma factor FlgM